MSACAFSQALLMACTTDSAFSICPCFAKISAIILSAIHRALCRSFCQKAKASSAVTNASSIKPTSACATAISNNLHCADFARSKICFAVSLSPFIATAFADAIKMSVLCQRFSILSAISAASLYRPSSIKPSAIPCHAFERSQESSLVSASNFTSSREPAFVRTFATLWNTKPRSCLSAMLSAISIAFWVSDFAQSRHPTFAASSAISQRQLAKQ